ncbi:hypothetical protein [Legionella sp. CNM-4043-24]|uniref:hypothetical protein n=1 Tax=Legionella sp. CNM-4043-24 TaxID=3421646 RepID=UPI00403AB32A
MSDDVKLLELIERFIQQTRHLTALLQKDLDYFRENDLSSIEKNNISKNEANERLIEILTEFNTIPDLTLSQGNLYEQLLQYTRNRTSQSAELDYLLAVMHNELDAYSQLLNVNRQLVTANMDFIKDIFSGLMNHYDADDKTTTYDRQGLLERV